MKLISTTDLTFKKNKLKCFISFFVCLFFSLPEEKGLGDDLSGIIKTSYKFKKQ